MSPLITGITTGQSVKPTAGIRPQTEGNHGFPTEGMHSSLHFHISNKYRSDKKEYRSVFSDKINNRYSCADPVLYLFTGLFEPPAGIGETSDMKPAVMPWTELRE
ncbi:MAG: hypothetical protein QUS35_07570 [bacterium]|nr:hypothetical protein [bacterium]